MIEELERIINESDNIVFFGGAGVSTESGIPDFRSQDGLYNQKYDYPPELILSDRFFYNNYEEFYRFYFDKMIYPDIKPNYTHEFLSKLESMGKLKAIVTQNIDNLHEQAGSKNIYHIQGTINTNHCVNCNKEYLLDDILKMDKVICTCGGMIKPDVVLYGEMLPEEAFNKSIEAISNADTLIVGGTSLTVYPAAGMINAFNGKNLIIINKDPVNVRCTLQINDKLGETFKKLNIGGKNE